MAPRELDFDARGFRLPACVAAGPKSKVGERENAFVGHLKAKVVGDPLHLHVRLQTDHDAEEIGNLLLTARLSLIPTELYQLF